MSKKPRRVCRPQAAKKENHFLSRHVRERKYLSGCQCAICASTAHKLCAQQTAILLSEKTGGFFDSLSCVPLQTGDIPGENYALLFVVSLCQDLNRLAVGPLVLAAPAGQHGEHQHHEQEPAVQAGTGQAHGADFLNEDIAVHQALDAGQSDKDECAGNRDDTRQRAAEAVHQVGAAIGVQLLGLAQIVGNGAPHDDGGTVGGAQADGGNHQARGDDDLGAHHALIQLAVDQGVNGALQQTAGVEDADDTGDGVQIAHGADHVVHAVNEEATQGAVLQAHDVRGNQDAADQADDGTGDETPGAGDVDITLDKGHHQQDHHGDQHDQALGVAVLRQNGLCLGGVGLGAGAAEDRKADGGSQGGNQCIPHPAGHCAGHIGGAFFSGVGLGGYGGDGGVGDGAHIVAEDGAAEDGAGQEYRVSAQQQAGGVQNGEGGEHGTDGGTGGRCDNAGGDKGKCSEAAAGEADHVAQPHKALGHAAAGHQLAEHTDNQKDQRQLIHDLGGHTDCNRIPVLTPVLGEQRADNQGHITTHAQVHHVKGLEYHEEQNTKNYK